MNRVEMMINAGSSFSRAWKDFIESYAKNPQYLYCFFEGKEDPRYYGSRIDNIVFSNNEALRENICCNGKDNMIRLIELIKNSKKFENPWIAFFIDKDFDENSEISGINDVYITPCYSVENLYVNQETLSRVIHNEFNIPINDEDYNKTIDLFGIRLNEFNDMTEDLNAWIFIQRNSKKIGYRLNLGDVTMDKLFIVNIDIVMKKYEIDRINDFFPDSILIEKDEIDKKMLDIDKKTRTEVFRGKYLLYFFRIFLKCLVEDSNKKSNRKHFSQRRKVQLNISDNIISELSQYASTPLCLVEFLHKLSARNTETTKS